MPLRVAALKSVGETRSPGRARPHAGVEIRNLRLYGEIRPSGNQLGQRRLDQRRVKVAVRVAQGVQVDHRQQVVGIVEPVSNPRDLAPVLRVEARPEPVALRFDVPQSRPVARGLAAHRRRVDAVGAAALSAIMRVIRPGWGRRACAAPAAPTAPVPGSSGGGIAVTVAVTRRPPSGSIATSFGVAGDENPAWRLTAATSAALM